MARLFRDPNAPWLLKGGYANELRLHGRARSTRDIDLSISDLSVLDASAPTQTAAIGALLQEATDNSLGDWFRFLVSEPSSGLQGPPEGGVRFPVTAYVGTQFTAFHVDVGLGDIFMPPAEIAAGVDLLDFAGIAPPRIKLLSKEQQFAEKAHAYSRPRSGRQNSRVKDLVDMVLFLEMGALKPEHTVRCLRATFDRYQTHPLPTLLLEPPDTWRAEYAVLALECGLSAVTLDEAYSVVSTHWADLPFAHPTHSVKQEK